MTFDARLCHGSGEEVQVDLHGILGGEYDLELATAEVSTTKQASTDADAASHCDFGTRVKGSGTLPTDFEVLRITADGETLQTVANEQTTPVMRPLPDPIA